ncbi:MAG TPA: threonine/serine dehydratase [Phototrophicaceae bacterium]|jgi:threonine dehydratase|nr:threonine/serine dehydratase [Phototrophicaceae bacterium]
MINVPAAPTFTDVLLAQRRIRPYLPPTPLYTYSAVNQLIGTTVFIKHENYQPVGAFKIRGGINLISQLTDDERKRGVVTASTGNHGQAIAYAAWLFGVKAQIVVPEGANPGKVAAIQGMGAEIIVHGAKFNDSVRHAEYLGQEQGIRFVSNGNEPLFIAGVATHTLEMLEAQPELDVIIVPVGSGGGAAGTCIAAHAINPAVRVIAVQSEKAPASYESWKHHEIREAANTTFAEGMATGRGFELPQQILWEDLNDFVLVSDEEIMQGMVWMIEHAHTLTESAGAASLAAAYKLREQLQGKKVGIIVSGGNTSLMHLQQALNTTLAAAAG